MLKKILFQAHWVIGITAGVVLAIVGLTGAILSFETPIQNWLNRDVRTVATSDAAVLSPAALIRAVGEQAPGKRVTSVQLVDDPTAAARIVFAPEGRGASSPNGGGRGGARGETRYANPYTGALIEGDSNRGQTFFRTTRSIHRWLMAGDFGNQDIGRQIVGASTLLCVVLTISGLYLRWPARKALNWRTWLTFNPAMKGRAFLWHLHAVLGTWVLVAFLLMSLTGLYWSYNWYRDGLFAIAGVERPAPREQRGRSEAGPRERGEGRARATEGADPQASVDQLRGVDVAWTTFTSTLGDARFATATVTIEPNRPIEIRYLREDASHDRANNTLAIDASTGEVVRHEQYASKRTGEKFMSSIFPLHSGSFFGLPGTVIYMLASLAMPIFAVTGWMLYLDRRRKKRAQSLQQAVAEAR